MNYFTRKIEESIRYCAVCERRTMHDRPVNLRAMWTCRDSGHRHPTKEDQEKGLLTMDNFESDIRTAVELSIVGGLACECVDECRCFVITLDALIPRVKAYWQDHADYPTNARIAEVVYGMERDGTLVRVLECTQDCEAADETGDEEIRCTTPCHSMAWAKAVPRYITLPEPDEEGDTEGENPAWKAYVAREETLWSERDDWKPEGTRLRLDIRRYTPRQTSAEYRLFYQDAEMPLNYDPKSRTYQRDDLPKVFPCGCVRDKVLTGNCEKWGRDGRLRGWQTGKSHLQREIEADQERERLAAESGEPIEP